MKNPRSPLADSSCINTARRTVSRIPRLGAFLAAALTILDPGRSIAQGFPHVEQPNPGAVLALMDGKPYGGARATLAVMHCGALFIVDQTADIVTQWDISNLQNVRMVEKWTDAPGSHVYGLAGDSWLTGGGRAWRPRAGQPGRFELYDPPYAAGGKSFFDPLRIDAMSGYAPPTEHYVLFRRATGSFRSSTFRIPLSEARVTGRPFILGNLLIIAGLHGLTGIVTYDISNPTQPRLLDFLDGVGGYEPAIYKHYLVMVNGANGGQANSGRRGFIVDFQDPSNLRLVREFDSGQFVGNTRYIQFQDDMMFTGKTKLSIEDLIAGRTEAESRRLVFQGEGGNDYLLPMGNLVAFAHYGGGGFRICAHQTARDTESPTVAYHLPRDGATNMPRTSRVGIMIHETLDSRTVVNGSTFIFRRVGTTTPLAGDLMLSDHDTLNFSPHTELASNTSYEVVIPAGGIKDVAGNGIEGYTFRFSTGSTVAPNQPPTIQSFNAAVHPAIPGQSTSFSVSASDPEGGSLTYRFNPGDGTGYRNVGASFSYTYANPGHYQVAIQVRDASGASATQVFTITVIYPPNGPGPANSSPIVLAGRRVWNVNPDSNTITAINADQHTKLFEVPVGARPRTLAAGPDGQIWVACQDADRIDIVNPSTRLVTTSIPLPYGSQPHGILMSADGSHAYVSLEGYGAVARINAATQTVVDMLGVGPTPRALARIGNRLLVTRFISPQTHAEVFDINLLTFTLTAVRQMAIETDPALDTTASGRGILNYLAGITISPDGKEAWIACKKDNVLRGAHRDGQALNFENTVRTVVARFDLTANSEVPSRRIDIDNSDSAVHVVFSPLGDYAFVALQGNDRHGVIDVFTGQRVTQVATGAAPQGAVFDPQTNALFTQNFLGRSITASGLGQFLRRGQLPIQILATVGTVQNELLTPGVLAGKRIFYNAEDPRMSRDAYISCASCHVDGGSDGRVWDFTDRGEGLRRTTDLRGRRGMGHGFVHWSANFDEIQDFEHDIRSAFGGRGFMSDADFLDGRDHPLGAPKAGVSPELDRLAAYVSSLTSVPASPFRTDGAATAAGIRGRQLFMQLACATCHGGADYTDSALGALHHIGTIEPASGSRLGGVLEGIDTPTLLGLSHASAYLHDGSASDLSALFSSANAPGGTPHAEVRLLSQGQRDDLMRFLLELDATEPAAPRAGSQIGGGVLREYWTGVPGNLVADLLAAASYPHSPSGRDMLTRFEAVDWANPVAASTWADDYGQRIRGWIHPPATGDYIFWIAGDNRCEVYLAEDEQPATARRIALVPGWTAFREWTKYAEQKSAPIRLVAGRRYYIEAVHKEGEGADSISVGWSKPGELATAPSEVIPGAWLTPWGADYWDHADIGTAHGAPGKLIKSGKYHTIETRSGNLSGGSDSFHFGWKKVSGDFILTTRVMHVDLTDAFARAGLMIRGTLDPASYHASVFIMPGNGLGFQRRTPASPTGARIDVPGVTAPMWVRLERAGSTITAKFSADGVGWTTVGSEVLELPDEVYAGFAHSSLNVDQAGVAEFHGTVLSRSPVGAVVALRAFSGTASHEAGQYVTLDGSNQAVARAAAPGGVAAFRVVALADGKVGLRSFNAAMQTYTGPLLRGPASTSGSQLLVADATSDVPGARFSIEWHADGRISLIGANGRYVRAAVGSSGDALLRSDSTTAANFQKFRIEFLEDPESYLTWVSKSGYSEGMHAPLDDPDGDGISSFLAYATGQSAAGPSTTGRTGGLALSLSTGGITIVIPYPARPDVGYTLEHATHVDGPWKPIARKPPASLWAPVEDAEIEIFDQGTSVSFTHRPESVSSGFWRLNVAS
jgi:regulation of enolase protein 1 (concanavalin A-like superfamily)